MADMAGLPGAINGRDSKYLLVEDLNSEMTPNKPFDSVCGGREKTLKSNVSKVHEGEATGFNETMSKVLGITNTQGTANNPVKITGLSGHANQIFTNGSFLDMQLTELKRGGEEINDDDNADVAAALRFQ